MPTPAVEDRAALTREAVVAAARAEIVEKGLDALSLRQVGAALGVTAPALYAYVADKRDLLRAVAELEFGSLIEAFDAVDEPDPVERLRRLSRTYIEYALDNPELFKTMFLFPPAFDFARPTGQELPIATSAFSHAEEAVRTAIAEGELRDDLDPVLIALTTWIPTHGLAEVLLLGFPMEDSMKNTLIDTVLDTVITGLRAHADH